MHPIRILILAILFYILYRILFGGKKKVATRQNKGTPESLSDTLEEDPICHTYIPRAEAVTLEHNGKTLYFCSAECRDKYSNTN